MIREVSALYFGIHILEDTETQEYYFQGLCSQIGLYERCIKMNQSEKQMFIDGKLDLDELLRNVCREVPGYKERLIPTPNHI